MVWSETAMTDGPYRESAAKGELQLPHCDDCNQTYWYPRPFCPHCHSSNTGWRRSAGRGSIYSFSIFRRTEKPYAIAYVAVDDGPIMLTNLVDCRFEDVAIGGRVKVRFHTFAGSDNTMPAFTLD